MKPFKEHHLLTLLQQFDGTKIPLDIFVNQYFRSHKSLGSHDRKFIADTTFHLIRYRLLYDHLVPPPPTWEKRLQLSKYPVSTNYLPPHIRVSFPLPYFELLENQYGKEKALNLCNILNTKAPTTIRVNTLKTSREALFHRWSGKYPVTFCQRATHGLQFASQIPVTTFPEFQEGLFEMQDEASQEIASLIQAKPKDHILDFCAGSGGKSLAIAPLMGGKGQLYLHDPRKKALLQAKKRIKRAGIQNVQFFQNPQKLPPIMDWVLVDTPCSGSGTLRRNPDKKYHFDPKSQFSLIDKQKEIITKALTFLKPGGKLVYATCSILQEENEQQVAWAQEYLPLQLIKTAFFLPEENGCDGFFGAVFAKLPSSSYTI